MKELLETGKYILANASPKAMGGPHTRYEPGSFSDISKRSCLDLIIVSKSLEQYIDEVIIDKELKFTPGYVTGNRMKYSDHFSILLKFKEIPVKENTPVSVSRESRWNTNKAGGWTKYYDLKVQKYC